MTAATIAMGVNFNNFGGNEGQSSGIPNSINFARKGSSKRNKHKTKPRRQVTLRKRKGK